MILNRPVAEDLPTDFQQDRKYKDQLFEKYVMKEAEQFADEVKSNFMSTLNERAPSNTTLFTPKGYVGDFNRTKDLISKESFSLKNADSNLLFNDKLIGNETFKRAGDIKYGGFFDDRAPEVDYRYRSDLYYGLRLQGKTPQDIALSNARLQAQGQLDPTTRGILQLRGETDPDALASSFANDFVAQNLSGRTRSGTNDMYSVYPKGEYNEPFVEKMTKSPMKSATFVTNSLPKSGTLEEMRGAIASAGGVKSAKIAVEVAKRSEMPESNTIITKSKKMTEAELLEQLKEKEKRAKKVEEMYERQKQKTRSTYKVPDEQKGDSQRETLNTFKKIVANKKALKKELSKGVNVGHSPIESGRKFSKEEEEAFLKQMKQHSVYNLRSKKDLKTSRSTGSDSDSESVVPEPVSITVGSKTISPRTATKAQKKIVGFQKIIKAKKEKIGLRKIAQRQKAEAEAEAEIKRSPTMREKMLQSAENRYKEIEEYRRIQEEAEKLKRNTELQIQTYEQLKDELGKLSPNEIMPKKYFKQLRVVYTSHNKTLGVKYKVSTVLKQLQKWEDAVQGKKSSIAEAKAREAKANAIEAKLYKGESKTQRSDNIVGLDDILEQREKSARHQRNQVNPSKNDFQVLLESGRSSAKSTSRI